MNFDQVEVTQVVAAQIPFYYYLIAYGILAVLIARILWFPKSFLKKRAGKTEAYDLTQWPVLVQLVALLLLVGFTLTQGVAAVTVYWQTMVENHSAHAYFSLMRPEKLLGLSHAHLFGYTVLFGFTGLMVCGTRLSSYIKGVLTCGMVISSFADVGSWWLIKYFGSAFDVVTYGAGTMFAGCFVISWVFILKTIVGSWRHE